MNGNFPRRKVSLITQKSKIRLASFALAFLLVLVGFTVSGWRQAAQYARQVDTTQQSNFFRLTGHLSGVHTALQKLEHAQSPSLLMGLTGELSRHAAAGIACLAQLPVSYGQLAETAEFLSRTSDFSIALSQRFAVGAVLAESDRKTIGTLTSGAETIASAFTRLQSLLQDGQLSLREVLSPVKSAHTVLFASALQEVEHELSALSFATDSITAVSSFQQTSEFTGETVSETEALKTAADFLSVSEELLLRNGTGEGEIPTYMFSAYLDGGEVWIEVARQGGTVVHLLHSRVTGELRLTPDEASEIAGEFLEQWGYPHMVQRSFNRTDGNLFITYVYRQEDVLMLPDHLTLAVALDSGKITFFNAGDFYLRHKPFRSLPDDQSYQYAAKELIDRGLCVILGEDGAEIPVRQWEGIHESGQKYLVYVHMETAQEVDILLLQEDDTGTREF